MKQTEVLLVGTGAVGSYFGGKLAQTDVRVSALCRSDFEIVKENGITIQSYKGDLLFKPAEVVKEAAQLSTQPDYILVCLKVLPEIDVERIIRKAVGADTAIVLIQNGIDIEKKVAAAFPDNEIISGIAFVAVSRENLGKVVHTGSGKLIFGNYPEGLSPKAKQLAGLFQNAGVPCELSDRIIKNRWQKMVWNVAFNPVSVLGGQADSLQMVTVPEAEMLIRDVMREVLTLAAVTGNELADEVMETAIAGNRKMRPFKTSMLVDFENNRPMEIDAILGNAIAIAEQNGVEVPFMKGLFALLKLQQAVRNH